jgi:predicted histidine transporter YuiF (NhaC family)
MQNSVIYIAIFPPVTTTVPIPPLLALSDEKRVSRKEFRIAIRFGWTAALLTMNTSLVTSLSSSRWQRTNHPFSQKDITSLAT